jgi:GT2 family glycosyltransferase
MAEIEPYSVVVVTYDHAETLPAVLAAVESLDPAPQRLVLVDNASTDGSTTIAADRNSLLRIDILEEDSNTGFAAAANRGIAATQTPWVLLLNPDCAPSPDFVAQLFEGAANRRDHQRIGAVTGKLLRAFGPQLAPEPVLDSAGMEVRSSGRHFDRGAGEPDAGDYDRPCWVFGGTGAATLFCREALNDVAYPNGDVLAATFFAYREDAELAWRLQWRGWRCLFVPTAVAAHRRGFRPEEGRRGHSAINRHSVRNRFLLRAHCADIGWHLRCLPWWLMRDLAVLGACLTIERGSLPAFVDLWRLRQDACKRRRWVMSRRSVPSQQLRRWFRSNGRVEEIEAP